MTKQTTFYLILCLLLFTSVNIFSQAPVITKQPSNQGVIEGQTATFYVEVTGDTLTYQWYKDGTIISGATDSIYTSPATVLADDGSLFSVKVNNNHGSDSSIAAKLFVTAPGERVTGGEIALYNFKDGSGNTIHDVSGVGSPLNLTINKSSGVSWSPVSLQIKDTSMIKSSVATKIISAITSSNEFTVELWLKPLDVINSRIFNLFEANNEVNFGVESYPPNGFNFVVRSTNTNNLGIPGTVDTVGLNTDLIHLVCIRSDDGISKIYRDGNEVFSENIGGNLSNWNAQAILSLAPIYGGTKSWKGIYYLAAVYNRALDSAEIEHNFNLGISVEKAPFIIEDPLTNRVLVGYSATFNVKTLGESPFTYQWQKNGVNITGATDSSYTINSAVLSDSGTAYRVIVTNSSGSDTSNNAYLDVKSINPDCPNGITHYYHFNEISSPYKDTVGFSDGTSAASPAPVTGIIGKALGFSNQEKIDIAHDIDF